MVDGKRRCVRSFRPGPAPRPLWLLALLAFSALPVCRTPAPPPPAPVPPPRAVVPPLVPAARRPAPDAAAHRGPAEHALPASTDAATPATPAASATAATDANVRANPTPLRRHYDTLPPVIPWVEWNEDLKPATEAAVIAGLAAWDEVARDCIISTTVRGVSLGVYDRLFAAKKRLGLSIFIHPGLKTNPQVGGPGYESDAEGWAELARCAAAILDKYYEPQERARVIFVWENETAHKHIIQPSDPRSPGPSGEGGAAVDVEALRRSLGPLAALGVTHLWYPGVGGDGPDWKWKHESCAAIATAARAALRCKFTTGVMSPPDQARGWGPENYRRTVAITGTRDDVFRLWYVRRTDSPDDIAARMADLHRWGERQVVVYPGFSGWREVAELFRRYAADRGGADAPRP